MKQAVGFARVIPQPEIKRDSREFRLSMIRRYEQLISDGYCPRECMERIAIEFMVDYRDVKKIFNNIYKGIL